MFSASFVVHSCPAKALLTVASDTTGVCGHAFLTDAFPFIVGKGMFSTSIMTRSVLSAPTLALSLRKSENIIYCTFLHCYTVQLFLYGCCAAALNLLYCTVRNEVTATDVIIEIFFLNILREIVVTLCISQKIMCNYIA